MARYRPADQDVVLFGEDLHDLQALHLYAVTTHPAGHANAFHNAAGIRGVTKRTRSTLPVMLTMRSLTDTAEAVTLDDTLKAFALGSTNDLDLVTFGEDVNGDGFT